MHIPDIDIGVYACVCMRVHVYACMCMYMGVKNSNVILHFPLPKENILTFFYKINFIIKKLANFIYCK